MMSMIILTSCQREVKETDLFAQEREKYIVFFSDEENLDKEGNYYDALLELKKNYPSNSLTMKVVPLKEYDKYSNFNINTFPTLLVMKNETVVKQIDGDAATEEIITSIEEALKK
ncbi:Thioredoxin [Litchfieldia salsa]|uniref:Thioredoxin n=2 Tax=Litchfieldia salsa TaxID=930152 RepID=A0A1H0RKP0_9BACI|nr:Thioredoxin [Litchfieldia salsa]